LNIAADPTAIYQSGQLVQIDVEDLLGNKTALRQFVNSFNQVVRENKQLNETISDLKVAKGKSELQPVVLIPAALVNIVGGGLIGLGTNYLTSSTVRPVADWLIVVAGVFLLSIGSIGPILYSHAISNRR
jgi:hypothetical protein